MRVNRTMQAGFAAQVRALRDALGDVENGIAEAGVNYGTPAKEDEATGRLREAVHAVEFAVERLEAEMKRSELLERKEE